MNTDELAHELLKLGIRADSYSLEGGLPSESYCLNRLNDKWETYYSERGQKTGLMYHDSEEAACKEFLNLIKSDSSVFK